MTQQLQFGSACSGIEAASLAWPWWRAQWLAEIEAFPSEVLAHRHPHAPNLGDMTRLPERILAGEVAAPDVFVAGTPCQAFSVAGLRRSLADARGNLALVFCEIANAIDEVRAFDGDKPAVIVWENVPGVLNTKDNAFGCFLAGLAGEDEPLVPAGPRWTDAGAVFGPQRTVAWRVLDAQYFGVAQRRRRVFVVASAREDFDPVSVLFEFDGLRRDIAPSRETGQEAPAGAGKRVAFGGNNTSGPIDVATARNACGTARNACGTASGRLDFESETFVVQPAIGFNARQDPDHWQDRTGPLDTDGGSQAVAFTQNSRSEVRLIGGDGGAVVGALAAQAGAQQQNYVAEAMCVRRLVPVEWERLQGMPDGYTAIPWRGKPAAECPDGPRYKAIGNSKAVPVVHWLGLRIECADALGGV